MLCYFRASFELAYRICMCHHRDGESVHYNVLCKAYQHKNQTVTRPKQRKTSCKCAMNDITVRQRLQWIVCVVGVSWPRCHSVKTIECSAPTWHMQTLLCNVHSCVSWLRKRMSRHLSSCFEELIHANRFIVIECSIVPNTCVYSMSNTEFSASMQMLLRNVYWYVSWLRKRMSSRHLSSHFKALLTQNAYI
jgi:hypothetical protein